MHILIVDDEPAMCETLKDVFQERGFTVSCAFDAREAMNKITMNEFDVGVIDIQLPDGDGLSILHEFKTRFPDAVSIIITGHASIQTVMDALKDSVDGYFLKPVNINEMMLSMQGAFETRRLHREIRESEALYRIIAENTSDLIIIVDEAGRLEYVNETALRRYLGYDPVDVLGRPFESLCHPDDVMNENGSVLACASMTGREVRLTSSINNQETWFNIKGHAFLDKHGREKCLLTCSEITAQQRYKALLEAENLQLKELTELQHAFVSNASHELRTPLFVIKGAIEFLIGRYGDELQGDVGNLVAIASRGASRLADLVELLVDYSEVSAGEIELHVRDEDFPAMLASILDELRLRLDQGSIMITTSMPRRLPWTFDPARVRRVVKHLVSNAINHVQRGGKIHVSIDNVEDGVQFSVHDDGIGFTPEEITQVFKKFKTIFRGKDEYQVNLQGFGLGLYVARKVIEKHGGKIWLESAGRHQGSTVRFTLPPRTM